MKKIIKLTEGDLANIVRQVIIEEKNSNNNQRYYSQRNLRRLGKTPVVMVESIDVYRDLLSEGIIDNLKGKISSLVDKSKNI